MRTHRVIPILLATTALLPMTGAHAADRPSPGSFTGEHGLRGTVSLRFSTERGIGLYLSKYTVLGDLRCDGEPIIPLEYSRMQVTARQAARVRGKRRTFTYRAATLVINGRFTTPKRITGTITGRASYCEQTAGFTARLK